MDLLAAEFETGFWPLFTRGNDASCVHCHDADNPSNLHFLPEPRSTFNWLLDNGYFAENEPDSLLGRLTATQPKKRMPKGRDALPWSETEINQLRAFSAKAAVLLKNRDNQPQFPASLLALFEGTPPESLDNQFLSFRQLKGKTKTLFNDDWLRQGRDLFQENISLFGGADFKERFSESSKASAPFLTGLDLLARDVAARAFAQKSGPFAGRPDALPSPLALTEPNPACITEIRRLYQHLLFRPPTPAELKQAFALLQEVAHGENEIRERDFELTFRLTVDDPHTGLTSHRTIVIPTSGQTCAVYQERINQAGPVQSDPAETKPDAKPARRRDRAVSGQLGRYTLAQIFNLKPGDPHQCARIHNVDSIGNVSFHALDIRPTQAAAGQTITLYATNPIVQAEGAWKVEDRRGFVSLEDENMDKGRSTITVPLTVEHEGDFELTLSWRKNEDNANAVLVEVFAQGHIWLAQPPAPPIPPAGQALYFIDQSEDTLAFADLNTAFQFHPGDYVEINNRGTRRRVTADAVKFVARSDQTTFLIDNDEADGRQSWEPYDSGEFRAYNQTGKNTYHDGNAKKGQLALRYKPALKPTWNSNEFYFVHVGYPAKRDHETRTPVVVHAAASSPIVQLAYPSRARAGAPLILDASATFTIQRSHLKFHWEQIGGPTVAAEDWNSPILRCRLPRLSAQQVAWEGLCRALLRHPDFIFTRPPSIETTTDPNQKRRLQLVKIAQDLLARPPTSSELQQLDSGIALAQMIERYLQSDEFKDFYFHRIRLYLESHGTPAQDEPVRLWCYIVFNDRPCQEILTANYTVDPQMQQQPRPNYHGHTGLLTTTGFIQGKPGLPHFNYAAQVAELFLGYVFEVPPEIVAQRDGITAASTTDPNSLCYSCHKILTPLAFQRSRWTDEGRFRSQDETGAPIDDTDRQLVPSYPFPGPGLEAFATQAARTERFLRTIINTHFTFYFGRQMRYLEDERQLYKRLWDQLQSHQFKIKTLLLALLTSPEYLEGKPTLLTQRKLTALPTSPTPPPPQPLNSSLIHE